MKILNQNDTNDTYGILDECNIKQVQFGIEKRFKTWYGSTVYFRSNKKTIGCKKKSRGIQEKSSKIVEVNEQYWLDTLYICEYCFKYYDTAKELIHHEVKCVYKTRLPGRIKYKSPDYTIRRVRGKKHELFCQCLCLFTKLFLDNKSVYFRILSYEFYIVYETKGNIPMGFFSKDLFSYNRDNLACILVFPPYQKKRLGTMLIDFSYRLSKNEGILAGPELPLSPFGLVCYLKFWSFSIIWYLTKGELSGCDQVSLTQIAEVTGIRINEVIMTLKYLDCITEDNEILMQVLSEKARDYRIEQGFMIKEQYLLVND